MKVLFLTNLYPYPLNSGGAIHSYTILKALSDMGHDIDLFCFKERDDEASDGIRFLSSATLIPHKIVTADNMPVMLLKSFVSLFVSEPFVVFKFRSKQMRNALKKQLANTDYDFIYFDHFNLGVYYPLIKKKIVTNKTSVILNEHNCEYRIMETNYAQESNFLKKCFLALETFKVKRFERKLIENVDFTAVLTEEDYADLKQVTQKDFRHVTIPVAIPERTVKSFIKTTDEEPVKLLFVGTLTWEPNDHGIRWFVSNVMPLLKGKAELKIAGKNPSDELKRLCKKHTDIDLLGFVEDLDGVYDKCDVVVAPIFIGSGLKVKVIEAFARGCPVISTEFAAKGIPHEDGKDIVIANTESEFVLAVEKMRQPALRKAIADRCYEVYRSYFSEDAIVGSIHDYIEELSASR